MSAATTAATAAARRVALVTGSTDGIGKHTATRLAREGYHVLLHGRSPERLEETRRSILSQQSDASLETLCHDLITLQGAKDLAAQVMIKTDNKLDVLINNAGVFQEERIATEDGLESTFAINVCATFILNALLMPALRNTAQARIINVSSISQSDIGRIDLNNLQFEKAGTWTPYASYSLSKLCVAMISHELALRTRPEEDALVVSCDPGTVNTKMLLAGWGACGIDVSDANCEFKLATSPSFDASAQGKYYVSCRESRCSKDVYEAEKREELWRRLEEICGVSLP